MKSKYFVYLIIISLVLRLATNLAMPFLLTSLKIDPITYGFIGGGINLLIFFSVVGLLVKIFRYENKTDFLNN
ncbi:hypothetical protein GCM10022260_04150 [Gaetbulibacter aestuarii]